MSLIIAGFLASVAAGATDWRSSSRVHSVGKSTTIQNPTPAVLVFEDSQYQELLSAAIAPAQLDVIDCSDLTKCNPPPEDVAARTIAVVTALPRNISLYPTLPKLKLFHSSFYVHPKMEQIQPETVGICYYLPIEYQNRSSVENGVDPMAEWAVTAVLDWTYKLSAREALFRQCAYAENAPLDCPTFSELTRHKTLWRSNTTVGVMGFGAVGKAMVDHFAGIGVNVIATDIHGPYTPLPKGLSWFGPDNDFLLANSDFIVVAVPDTVLNIINKTSLGLMKSTSVLIPLDPNNVEWDALYDALFGNLIGGAILDVWPDGCWGFKLDCGPPYGATTEPYSGKGSFRDLPNVRMTPNVMFQSDNLWDNSAAFTGANLRALVNGDPLQGVVRNITG